MTIEPRRHRRGVRALYAAVLLSLLTGCASVQPAQYSTFMMEARADASAAPTALVKGLPVRSGDIVVAERGSAASAFLSLLAEEFFPFIHSGVISVEGERAYVYEAFATLRPQLSGPPTDALQGRIRRVTLERFLSRQQIAAVYTPPPHVDAAAIARFARDRYLDGTPFDAYFDAGDPSALYCNELVALALAAGGATPIEPVPIRANASLAVVLGWLKIETKTLIPAGVLLRDLRLAVTLSRDYTPKQIEAYFAAKRELHARFSGDQKLGNVFHWSPFGLRFRPAVKRYITAMTAEPRDLHSREHFAGSGEQSSLGAGTYPDSDLSD